MDTLKIGHIIRTPQSRDAIHMAIIPIEAGEDIRPGHHVGIKDGKATTDKSVKRIGIVDPFLGFGVLEGQVFWLFIYPGGIGSLKHHWTHPELDKVTETVFTPEVVEYEAAEEDETDDDDDPFNCCGDDEDEDEDDEDGCRGMGCR